jgi:hypothetical protein
VIRIARSRPAAICFSRNRREQETRREASWRFIAETSNNFWPIGFEVGREKFIDLSGAAVDELLQIRLPHAIASAADSNVRDFALAALFPERGFRESEIGRSLLAGHKR